MTLSWNLMCRISNSIDVHFSHIDWKEDALAIIFCHMKNDQQGERPRDPRHIYANPLIPEVCPVLSLGVYLLCFPPSPECTQLFPGHKQDDRYSKILKRLLTLPDHVEEVRTMGINPDDIGTHSIRKGASTFTASGSTAAPSSTAVHLRAGWALGGVQDTYLRYEAAGDHHVGRTVCGLPLNKPEFALPPPFFIDEGNAVLLAALRTCFPQLPLSMKRASQFALASVVYHRQWLRAKLPPGHRLFSTALFIDATMLTDLASQVQCRAVTPNDPISVTGIPPQVEMMVELRELGKEVRAFGPTVRNIVPDIINGVSNLLEENAIEAGTVTRHGLRDMIQGILRESGLNAGLSWGIVVDLRLGD